MPTPNQKGLPTFCRREEAELPGWSFPCCWASWRVLCFPPSVTVCCQRLGFVSWLLTGTFCILPVNSAVDFLICSMWLASTDRACRAKKNPMEQLHLPALFYSLCLPDVVACAWAHSVCGCLCITKGHMGVSAPSTLLTLKRGKARLGLW